MNQAKKNLIEDQTSPLFRIMSIYDDTDPEKRQFEANISAFHIGGGFILSVAHYLHTTVPLMRSAPDAFFQSDIIPKLNRDDANQLLQCYPLNERTQKRYLNIRDETIAQSLINKLQMSKCDTRIKTLFSKGVCKPYLIVQFKNNSFFNDPELTSHFNPIHIFHEPQLNRYTFLLELEIKKIFLEYDITVYRLSNPASPIINALPSVPVDYNIYDDESTNLFCLQSSPSNSNLGRLLNRAQIEGVLDHWANMPDNIQGSYIFEGLRYLIRGYFRFGSSGAPYLKYDDGANQFKAIAIQSEACPIQLTIKNDREGNFQYVNALASPLSLVSQELPAILNT